MRFSCLTQCFCLKKNNLGNMETDAIMAHGATTTMHALIGQNSNNKTLYVCSKCGHIVSGHKTLEIYDCPFCVSSDNVREIIASKSVKVLIDYLTTMKILVRLVSKINCYFERICSVLELFKGIDRHGYERTLAAANQQFALCTNKPPIVLES
jgi:hypothetical protein